MAFDRPMHSIGVQLFGSAISQHPTTSLYSEGPLVQRATSAKGHWSEGPFSQNINVFVVFVNIISQGVTITKRLHSFHSS